MWNFDPNLPEIVKHLYSFHTFSIPSIQIDPIPYNSHRCLISSPQTILVVSLTNVPIFGVDVVEVKEVVELALVVASEVDQPTLFVVHQKAGFCQGRNVPFVVDFDPF